MTCFCLSLLPRVAVSFANAGHVTHLLKGAEPGLALRMAPNVQITLVAYGVAEVAKSWGQNDDIAVVTVRRNG